MSTRSKRPTLSRQRSVFFVLLLACTFIGYVWAVGSRPVSPGAVGAPEANAQPYEPPAQGNDYSRFTHSNAYHSRMPCLLCHRRDDNSTRITFPGKNGHTPCIGCHSLQFSDNSSPICTICHTDPNSGAMKRFPSLRSFGRRFNHSRHQRVNCSVCHKPSQRGVALSIPSGPRAHATCFQCHTSNASFPMASCNNCHQPGRLVRTPETAAAYRINFSHDRHRREGLACTSCHSVRAGATGRQVSKPLAAMHFAPDKAASCAACHDGKRAFGANEFANCKRCHQGNSFRF